jgi:SAM-dependent methyltransferase
MTPDSELLQLLDTLYCSKNPTRRWLHCTRRDWIVATLGRYAKQGRRKALEVGFGLGVYLPALTEMYDEVVAIDVDEDLLERGRSLAAKYPNLHLAGDDITHSALSDNSFDIILCTEVVEHIADSAKAIAEMHRILRPHGVLVLSTPQRRSPLEVLAKIAFKPGIVNLVRMLYGEPVYETGHINLMSENQVGAQLRMAGFTIRERHKSGAYLPLIAEFLGERGLRIEQWLEPRMRGGIFDGLLWTQYYVAEK